LLQCVGIASLRREVGGHVLESNLRSVGADVQIFVQLLLNLPLLEVRVVLGSLV